MMSSTHSQSLPPQVWSAESGGGDLIDKLGIEWSNLRALEKGERLLLLLNAGHSQRTLAMVLGCSRRLVRQLLDLASLPSTVKSKLREGSVGRKKALRGGRQKRLGQELEASLIEEHDRRVTVEDYSTLIEEWLLGWDLLPCDMEMFFDQVNQELYGFMQWEFEEEAPKPGGPRSDGKPNAIIDACRPPGTLPGDMPRRLNYLVTWFARWSQRVIPERKLVEQAVDYARRRILRRRLKSRLSSLPQANPTVAFGTR